MQVFLDDRLIELSSPSLARAVQLAASAAANLGRIVVEASCDGSAIADSELQNPGAEPWARGDIRFVSVEPTELIRATLADAASALEAAKADQLACAEMIQSGDLDGSLAPLGRAIETWRAVRDAVERSVELLGAEGAARALKAGELEPLVRGLSVRLEEIRRSLAAQDWASLSDVLAYDMAGQVDQWRVHLAGMVQRLVHPTMAREVQPSRGGS